MWGGERRRPALLCQRHMTTRDSGPAASRGLEPARSLERKFTPLILCNLLIRSRLGAFFGQTCRRAAIRFSLDGAAISDDNAREMRV